ncbi:MAG: N-6 DNA methylase [Candidatus Kerfeldbacteria bacterium CG08_land_8_20_14_0_20_40_16]|uniref:site-specific DNA-methyltransferase (adenine-specific) n=1 Tax=Candidatus Kerfeldbacteria bacterium CG08_land_8_20_14_0_20_40_16 TaxID=2014244 RepID=A0A2H0YZA1_9BACT|nr:MAG: N-6 DNA methylase [Candidatus Kerfeldbacteria bacterium CG08_land_8_20_14_0_20_40_16]
MKSRENYLTIAELAKMLNISRVAALKKVKKLIEGGKISASEKGKGYIINRDSLPTDLKEEIIRLQKDASKKAQELSVKNGKDIDFEKELWKAADKLRGNIDASDYKYVVLGLIFLKYVSDAYYQRREVLEKRTLDKNDKEYYVPNEDDRKSIIESKDEYKSKGVFYIPEKARWEFLRSKAMQSDIGKKIDEAMEAIENENPKQLKGILPKIFTRTPLESQILGELVNIFSKIKFDHDFDKEKDTLGRVYEYFLGQFASAEGKRGGEFYTPRSIVKLIVEVLQPYENARVFDPACGSGGMFVQSARFLEEHDKDKSRLSFFGQESNPTTLKLCKMNLAIRGIIGQIELGNSYYDDKFPDLRADFVIANPPFNADWEPSRLADNDPRIKFGSPPGGNANFMWIQHFIHHLSPQGIAGFVMANGALAVSGRDGEIRKKIIKSDLIDVIIACPPKLFYNVALPVSLWFASKNKTNGRFRNRRGEILFIDAREIFEQLSRKQVIFTDEQIQKIVNTARAWRGEKGAGKYEDVAGFCKAVKLDEVEKNGYVLTPGRYVGVAEEEDDGVPFEEKMQKLNKELKQSFIEGDILEQQIIKNLSHIKHGND